MSFIADITETKVFMQITGTASDVLIAVYLDMVEAEVEAYVGRPLARATYTETLTYLQSKFDKTGYTLLNASQDIPKLFLSNYPIVSGSLVITSGDAPVTQSDFSYDVSNGVLSPNFQLTEPTATYVAGYTTATAPTDLKAVVKLGVSSLFNNNKQAVSGSGNVKSKRIKDFSVDYGNDQTGYVTTENNMLVKNYIASNKVILNKYLRVDV